MTTEPKIIPPGDYEVKFYSSGSYNTAFKIITGPYEGRLLHIPRGRTPIIILTVTVEEEVTTTERNVVRFKDRQANVFKTRPREGPPTDGPSWLD